MKNIFCNFFENEKSTFQKVLYCVSCFSFALMSLSILLFSNNKLHLMYYVFFGIFAISVVANEVLKKNFKLYFFDALAITFIICVSISKILNPSSLFATTPYSVFAIFIVCNHFINKSNTKFVLLLLHTVFIVFLIVFIVYYRDNIFSFDFQTRIGDFFQNENTVGYYFVYGLVLCLWVSSEKKFNLLWLIPALLDLLMICYTGSRSSLIIAIIIITIYVFYSFGLKRVWVSFIIVALTIGLFLLILKLPSMSSFASRIINLINGNDTSAYERATLLREGIFMFASKPLVGWGYNGMISSSSGHLFAHNNFVQLLSDFGIIGFMVFETIVFVPLIITIKERKHIQSSCFLYLILILTSVILIQFFYANYQLKFEYMFLSASGTLTIDKIKNSTIMQSRKNSYYECYI